MHIVTECRIDEPSSISGLVCYVHIRPISLKNKKRICLSSPGLGIKYQGRLGSLGDKVDWVLGVKRNKKNFEFQIVEKVTENPATPTPQKSHTNSEIGSVLV